MTVWHVLLYTGAALAALWSFLQLLTGCRHSRRRMTSHRM